MSFSATPADLFRHLSLDTQMSPTSEEVKARAPKIRDVLSSFDRDIFPSEFREDIFANLDRPSALRPQHHSGWTIQQDFVGTTIQWAAYNEQHFQDLMELKDPQTLTLLFQEKLSRRLRDIFFEYDELKDQHSDPKQVQDLVEGIAQKFRGVALAVQEDRKYREDGHLRTSLECLAALIGVCERDDDIPLAISSAPPQRSRRSTTSTQPSGVSLFQTIIRSQKRELSGGSIILDLLDTYNSHILTQMASDLSRLRDLLRNNGAPLTYITRTEHLLSRAEDQPSQTSPLEPTSASSATATANITTTGASDPSPNLTRSAGSKRSATQQGSAKRGRKKAK